MDEVVSKEFFLVARITSVFGSEGFVSIISFSDDENRFFELDSVFIDVFGGKREFFLEEVKKRKENILLKFSNFNSSKEVDFLVGCEIFIDQKSSIKLDEDSYFVHDLMGSEVFLQDNLIGTINEVVSTPANDLYVVITPEGKEVLIPAVKEFIMSFNVEKKRLELKSECRTIIDDEN